MHTWRWGREREVADTHTAQTRHAVALGKLVLSCNRPRTKRHSVIPAPPAPPELSRSVPHPLSCVLQDVMLRAAAHLREEDIQVITTQGSTAGDTTYEAVAADASASASTAGSAPGDTIPANGILGDPGPALESRGGYYKEQNGTAPSNSILTLLGQGGQGDQVVLPAPGLLPTPGEHGDMDKWDIPVERPINDPSFFHEGPDATLHAACMENEPHRVADMLRSGLRPRPPPPPACRRPPLRCPVPACLPGPPGPPIFGFP